MLGKGGGATGGVLLALTVVAAAVGVLRNGLVLLGVGGTAGGLLGGPELLLLGMGVFKSAPYFFMS